MRTPNRILLAAGSAALVALAPAIGAAQNDVTPHLPNVLLLVDTSGSMQYLLSPSTVDNITPVLPGDPNAPAPKSACALDGSTKQFSRWITLVEALTGTFQPGALGCETLMRNEPKFVSEFALPGNSFPYDYEYYLPWSRLYAGGCTIGSIQPVSLTQDWTNWGTPQFDFHDSAGPCNSTPGYTVPFQNTNNCCNMNGQNNDGLLDSFSGLVRFGLMTLDTFPDPSTGSTPPTLNQVDLVGGQRGMWSYFDGWQASNPPTVPVSPGPGNYPAGGNPNMCTSPTYVEVGARNPAAPPWEGPLVPFGNWQSDTNIVQTNAQIQLELMAMRPYGATPIAGLLDDAREFLFTDKETAPGSNPTASFGPSGPNGDGTYGDKYWAAGCRKTAVILLTDGEPNLDLRSTLSSSCDSMSGPANGKCPYQLPEDIATSMYNGGPNGLYPNQSVTTYVVGFAMDNPLLPNGTSALPNGRTSCGALVPATDCNSALPNYSYFKDCCELQKIALAGSNNVTGAFFASNTAQLKATIATILSQLVGTTTARTTPVFAPAGAAAAQGGAFVTSPALSYHFAASFNVTSASVGNIAQGGGDSGIWSGNLKRERWVCNSQGQPAPMYDPAAGDDYAANITNPDATHPRLMWTYVPPVDGSGVAHPDWTIRPYIQPAIDGFGPYGVGGVQTPLTQAGSFPGIMAGVNASVFGVAPSNDPNCFNAFGATTSNACITDLFNWELGLPNALPATFINPPSRQPSSAFCQSQPANKTGLPSECSLLGAIYHSTPAVIGPPREFLRDDTYTTYANTAAVSGEPIVLYTASIDGQLHAFKVSASVSTDTYTTNLPGNNELWSFFPPAVLQHLLPNYNTGGANLLDGSPVLADIPAVQAPPAQPIFERAPGNPVTIWRRVLVAGGGAAGGFYYALDVTDPNNPQFLWQLATDEIGDPMFGASTPTPTITIVTLDQNFQAHNGSTPGRAYTARTQVPVAILPGGTGLQAPTCTLSGGTPPASSMLNPDPHNPSNPMVALPSFVGPTLRCWGSTSGNNQNGHGQGNWNNGASATGNSLTVVRLDTGEVLAHLTGPKYFGAAGNRVQVGGTAQGTDYPVAAFAAPITGIPAVYPSDTGQSAQRIYVGDADGRLWRVDLSSPDPISWQTGTTLAWDSYIDSTTAPRESIQLQPVVSRDPIGNLVIIFATGDQNVLTSQSTANRVWSITETPSVLNTSMNWFIPFLPGFQRVTGPMALLNEVLYFSTYSPLSSDACSDGFPSLWNVDYRRPDAVGQPKQPLGATMLSADGAQGSVVFGVSAAQIPSCTTSAPTTDAYFGGHTAVTGGGGEYRIMWQTGAASGISTTTNPNVRAEGGITGMQNMTVSPPGQSTRIDSWGAIVE